MKFRYKITLWMISLLALFYAIGGTILISYSFRSAMEREKESAHASYQMILDTLRVVNQTDIWLDNAQMSGVLRELSSQGNSSWEALRLCSSDEILYEEGGAAAFLQNASEGLSQNECLITQFSDDSQKQYLQVSSQLQFGDEQLELDVAYDITSIYITRSDQQTIYFRLYIIMLLIGMVVVYIMAYVMTRPLSNLSKAARHIASGNLSYRSMIRSNDEIGDLSKDFNGMAERVEKSMEDMQLAMYRQEQFMGSFAHELKTPMTSIIGYADLIRRQTLSEEEEGEAANYIFTEGKRLERLSLKMLDIFSMEQNTVSFSSVSLAGLIQEITEHLRPVYEKNGIILECDCETGRCMLEPDLIRSLLLNLIDNARKAVGNKGRIRISSFILAEGCRIVVEDDGPGIPEEAVEHLTEAFYRVDKARSRKMGGAGLGLTLCAKIVELHQGRLWFEPNQPGGLRVIVEWKGGGLV